jgi:hypothetical protein
MRRVLVSATKITLVLAAISSIGFVGMSMLQAHAMSTAFNELNSFCNAIPTGMPQSDLVAHVEALKGYRFTSSGDDAFISLHTCHCIAHFQQMRAVRVGAVICND